MEYEQLRARDDAAFRRFCGVPKPTFQTMLEVLEQAEAGKKVGRPNKLSLPDQLLLALSYWREYRTLFHIAADYALHESTAQRIVCRVEDRLLASGRFTLLPKDTLLEEGPRIALVALDATECPMERPRKNSDDTTVARRNGTQARYS